MQKNILDNYSRLRDNIKEVCKKVNRDPDEINLVAVSKERTAFEINKLLNSKHICFGENRIEEANTKWSYLKKKDTKLHFIGALQSKKVKKIMKFFDVIETLDTESSAKSIANFFSLNENLKNKKKIFVQINIGAEFQKRGIKPNELKDFIEMCTNKYAFSINGAMCMAPLNKEPSLYFKHMKKICLNNDISSISMGMSNDYEEAIINGATNIRVGSLIFGKKL